MSRVQHKIEGIVDRFPGHGGWHFVRVSRKLTDGITEKGAWGYVRIVATVGKTTWETSLLPYGDGSYFIALNAKVRKTEHILLGETVTLMYVLN